MHRSAILNLDRVREIEPFDTGDARAHLLGGGVVPVSRRLIDAPLSNAPRAEERGSPAA